LTLRPSVSAYRATYPPTTDQIEAIKGDNLFYFYFYLPFAYATASSHLAPLALLFALLPLSLFRGLQTSQTTVLLALAAMPMKRMFKRVTVADATSKKEKTSGCARSAFRSLAIVDFSYNDFTGCST
jgi:hypothetical protein